MEYALAFSLEGREIKTALVSKRGKTLSIELVRSFIREEGSVDIIQHLSPLIKGKKVKTISALPSGDIVLRELQLPMTNPGKILSVLPFQAETLIPYAPEETLLYPYICKNGPHASRIFLTATKKEKLTAHLNSLQALRIEPDQVSTNVHALARWASLATQKIPILKAAYLGRSESFFLMIAEGRILTAKSLSYPHFSLDREIKKADEFLASKFPESQGKPWLFAGEGMDDLPPWELAPSVILEEPFAKQASFAIAIGLGLEALATDGKSVQWRQGMFSPLEQRKKQKKQILFASAAFLCAAAALGPFGHMICNGFEQELLERTRNCLQAIAPEKKARAQDLESACLALDTCMLTLKKEEKFGSFAPKVSDLLAWLSITDSEHEQVFLNSLQYALTPHGQVEINLSLQAPSSIADSFLKKLQREDSLIDKDFGIVWKKEKNQNYNAHFYLKN